MQLSFLLCFLFPFLDNSSKVCYGICQVEVVELSGKLLQVDYKKFKIKYGGYEK